MKPHSLFIRLKKGKGCMGTYLARAQHTYSTVQYFLYSCLRTVKNIQEPKIKKELCWLYTGSKASKRFLDR